MAKETKAAKLDLMGFLTSDRKMSQLSREELASLWAQLNSDGASDDSWLKKKVIAALQAHIE